MNGLREFYADADAKKIKALEAQLQSKDEIIITTLKAIMLNMNLDFDHAFAIAEIDPSLKEEYRKLIEE